MTKSVHNELKHLQLRLIDAAYESLSNGHTLKAVVLVDTIRVAAEAAEKAMRWAVVGVEEVDEEEIVIHEEIPNA